MCLCVCVCALSGGGVGGGGSFYHKMDWIFVAMQRIAAQSCDVLWVLCMMCCRDMRCDAVWCHVICCVL